MNKLQAARWFSVIVASALVIGCGNRSDKPQPIACVPQTESAVKAPATSSATTLAAPTPSVVASAAPAADKPAAKAAKAKVAVSAPVKVRRLVVSEGVERATREPLGQKGSFKAADTDKIYAFVELDNPDKSESEVFVTFEPASGGASQGQISLKVGAAPRWRTWAYTRGVKKAGSWAAVVRSEDGTVLARTPFDVTL